LPTTIDPSIVGGHALTGAAALAAPEAPAAIPASAPIAATASASRLRGLRISDISIPLSLGFLLSSFVLRCFLNAATSVFTFS
jgi:hypothetical protein